MTARKQAWKDATVRMIQENPEKVREMLIERDRRIEELEAEARRAWDYVEAQFDVLTAEQLTEVARAKGEDVEATAARVREIFQAAYRRVVGSE